MVLQVHFKLENLPLKNFTRNTDVAYQVNDDQVEIVFNNDIRRFIGL